MKICIVAEGCYPYVVGGVSSWIHSIIKTFPNYEFVIMAIVADRSLRGKFAYELPENVSEVRELYLQDDDWQGVGWRRRKRLRLSAEEYSALRSLLLNENANWEPLFELFSKRDFTLNELLMGEDFFNGVLECYRIRHSEIVFSDFLWTLRSIYLPLFFALKADVPQADVYHCVSTGYAGMLGSKAKWQYGCGLVISEHGIYTREREEELIRAKWVSGIYKNIWIDQFRKMSSLAYDRADLVTSLYEYARELQAELGCPRDKQLITPNGIDVGRFCGIEPNRKPEQDKVHIGAVLRVTPIKDVKTMLLAFAYAKKKMPNLKLWIMGPADEDEEYAQECYALMEQLEVPDVVFTGRVNVTEYLGFMDMVVLTSISEGQPLTILESFAARKPVIATDVGNCRGLICGEGDGFGEAGIVTHVMNEEEIADAMVKLARDPQERAQMGERGYKRVLAKYQIKDMKKVYQRIYQSFETTGGRRKARGRNRR